MKIRKQNSYNLMHAGLEHIVIDQISTKLQNVKNQTTGFLVFLQKLKTVRAENTAIPEESGVASAIQDSWKLTVYCELSPNLSINPVCVSLCFKSCLCLYKTLL